MTDALQQFRDALAQRRIIAPASPIADGNIHRCDADGRNGKGDAAYLLHLDGVPSGGFQEWRDGRGWETWTANIGRTLSAVEVIAQRERIEAGKRLVAEETERRRAFARDKAAGIWARSEPAPDDHPYLVAKGVKAHGLRHYNGALVVPVREDGELHSLQFIGADGSKRFLTGGKVNGCYHSIGSPGDTICITEGYATGASVHEATGQAVAVAFDAGRLLSVAKAMRAKFPNARLILCADDDHKTEGNPGLTKATEAALAVGGLVAVPEFGDDRKDGDTDLNDVAKALGGAEAIKRAVANAKTPEVSTLQPSEKNATAAVLEAQNAPRVMRLDELLLLEIPEREAILAPWLPTQSLSMIHAWRGVGKTHIALGVAFAVATGGKFLNWSAPRPRSVLYLDGEMPAVAIKKRLAVLVEADERDFDPGLLRIVTPDVQDGPMPDLATSEGQAAVESVIGNAELIIVDNISTLIRSGGGENDAESGRGVQGWALQQRRTGRAVLFIHHSAKGGQQRGSSKREDTLDVVIKLQRPSDYLPEQGARFEVHFEKYRNGSGDEAKAIEAHLTTDQHGAMTWTWRDADEGTLDRVVALAGDGLRPREIAEELGVNKSTVSRHLAKARGLGMIVRGAA
jgi:putative DNA primase/helicase